MAMGRRSWWGAVATVGLLTSGCGHASQACPLYMAVGTVSVQAGPYVAAHPGTVARMGVCVVDRRNPCVGAALEPVGPGTHYRVTLGNLSPGKYRVRVILADSAGHAVLNTMGYLMVHQGDAGACPHMMGGYGAATIDAHGTLTTN